MKRARVLAVVTSVFLAITAAACGSSGTTATDAGEGDATPAAEGQTAGAAAGEMELDELLIAQQFGVGYAPLVVLENRPELAEPHLPGVTLKWTQLGAGTSLRDAMLAGQLSVGSGGAGPVIDGITKGVEFAIATGLVEMPMWMTVAEDGPDSLEEFEPSDKIAIPGLASSQHVALRAGLREVGLDPLALENNLVPMPHPDGLTALTSGQVTAHVTSAPFQYVEVEQGATKLIDTYELWGRHTFLTVYTTREFAEQNPNVFQGLVDSVNSAVTWVNENMEETAEILSEASEGQTSPEELLEQLQHETITFSSEISNIKPMADAMFELGFIEREITSEELFFPTASVEGEEW
jgi:NitT/TauT family transport system substrate-binding protein